MLATLSINAGGPAIGDFQADSFVTGGRTYGPNASSISPIDLSGAVDPAPAAVYRTERTGVPGGGGAFSYRIPNLLVGETYTLRLHFAEIYFESANSRIFDVQINGAQPPALDDYDVFVASGDQGNAAEKVVIEEFVVSPQSDGALVLDFTASVNNAKLSALELSGEFPELTGPRLLFVRGADRSGGFLEADNDAQRTEQLADIYNDSTAGGNHGWNELRVALEAANFQVEQITEGAESASGPSEGVPIDFDQMNLSVYDAIVFGSNNAAYGAAAVDAVELYIRGGGSALFISDANFGSDWADASNSDQPLLDRFGLIMHQDQGTYSLFRNSGDFDAPDHPILTNVDRFDGEGVTPIEVGTLTPGVSANILAGAKNTTRLNQPPFGGQNQGPSRVSNGAIDAASLAVTADEGKIVGHFDRNTFFNQNGAGTNINRFDNKQYALNLFGWLVGAFDPVPGDYDESGLVDELDYDVWRTAYGSTGENSADGNGDGQVNGADYTVWRNNLGASRPDVDLTPTDGGGTGSSDLLLQAAFASLPQVAPAPMTGKEHFEGEPTLPADTTDLLLIDRFAEVADSIAQNMSEAGEDTNDPRASSDEGDAGFRGDSVSILGPTLWSGGWF